MNKPEAKSKRQTLLISHQDFIIALKKRDFDTAQNFLETGFSIDAKYKDGQSPLQEVTADQQSDLAKWLIERDALLNETDERDAKTQLIFDLRYLRVAFSTHCDVEEDSLREYCESVSRNIDLASSLSDRIATAADLYWNRTSLLFSLLA